MSNGNTGSTIKFPTIDQKSLKVEGEDVLDIIAEKQDQLSPNSLQFIETKEGSTKVLREDGTFVEMEGTDSGTDSGTTVKGTWEPEVKALEFHLNYVGDFGENEQISIQKHTATLSNEMYQQITLLGVHDLTEGIQFKYKLSDKIEHDFTLYSSGMSTLLQVKENSLSFNISPTDTISINWNQNEEISLYVSYDESSGKLKAIFNEETLEIDAGVFSGIFDTQNIIYSTDGMGTGEYGLELLSELTYPDNFQNNAFIVIGSNLEPEIKDRDVVIGNPNGDGIALVISKESQGSFDTNGVEFDQAKIEEVLGEEGLGFTIGDISEGHLYINQVTEESDGGINITHYEQTLVDLSEIDGFNRINLTMDMQNDYQIWEQSYIDSEQYQSYDFAEMGVGQVSHIKYIGEDQIDDNAHIADTSGNMSQNARIIQNGVPSQFFQVQDSNENKALISMIVEDGESEIIFSQDKFTGLPGISQLKDVNNKSSSFTVNENDQGKFFKLTDNLVITLDSVSTDKMFKIEFKSQGNHVITFEDTTSNKVLDQYGFGQVTNKGFVTQLWDGSEWSIDGGLDLIEP